MSPEPLASLVISSIVFGLPRMFPTKLYTIFKKLFTKKKTTKTTYESKYDPSNPQEVLLEKAFQKSCRVVEKASSLTTDQSLEFYGLFKQAHAGDCNKPRPSDMVELKKW